MTKVVILMGLPGSGKTYFSETYYDTCGYSKGSINHINIDKIVENKYSGCKDAREAISKKYNPYARVNIIDGLLLTNQDVIDAIKYLPDDMEQVEIHYWELDRDACLYNDEGRRNHSSRTTILNANLERPDKEMIKKKAHLKDVYVRFHTVKRKPFWRKTVEQMKLYVEDGHYLYSETWSLGGEYGNCWDSEMTPVDGDAEPAEFTQLDFILETLCSGVSFREYKDVYRNCVTIKERFEADYYGGGVTYAYYSCDLEKLFAYLEEKGFLSETEEETKWETKSDPKKTGFYWVTSKTDEGYATVINYWDETKWFFEDKVYAWMPMNPPAPYAE